MGSTVNELSQEIQNARNVTSMLLDDRRMIEACATHDFKAVLQLLHAHGLSLTALASATGISPARMHECWTGQRQPSSFEFCERLSDGLHIPGRYLRLADRPWEQAHAKS